MDKAVFTILVVSLVSFANALVKILELDVPESVEIGSTDEIVMVCNFEATRDEAAEMKWFYNGNVEQIYQWIPDSDKPPGAMGRFKDRLDLRYAVSSDPHSKYKALKIKNVSYDLSGNYTCKVSGFKSEDSQTKQLIIYSPPKSDMEIILFKNENLVICTVSGIYPMPELDFYILDGNDTIDIVEQIEFDEDEDGFNVTARYHFDNATLNPTTFLCNLTIPGTDFNLNKQLDYYIEDEGVTEEEDYITWLNSNDTSEDNQNKTVEDNAGIRNHPTTYVTIILLVLSYLNLS